MKNKLLNILKLEEKEWLSFLGVFLITLGNYFYVSWMNKIFRTVLAAVIVITGIVFLSFDIIKNLKEKKYTKKQLKTIGILVGAGVLVWHAISVYYTVIVMVMHFLDKDFRKLFKYIFISSVFSFGLLVLLNIIGLIPGYVMHRGILKRYSLGFKHPNILFRMYITILISGAIMYKNDKYFLIGSLIIGMLLFLLTNSRAGVVVLLIFYLLSILPKNIKRKFAFNKCIPYLFVFGILVSTLTGLIFGDGEVLNGVGSGRPGIWYTYLQNISVIGRFNRVNNLPLDNLYLHILAYGGIIGVIFYIWLYFVSFSKKVNKGNYNVFIIFAITLVYGYAESMSLQSESYFLILLIMQLMDCKKLEELDDDYIERTEKI